ncbi:MAG: hypothetical protein AABX33_00625 [Nanoarchaeota archaeon]
MFVAGLFFIAVWVILWDLYSNKIPKKSLTTNVRICPKCKKPDVSSDLSAHSFAQGSVFNNYKCNQCGHSSIFFPEIETIK